MNSLYVIRFIIIFGNTLLILYFYANLLWIRFHLREFTIDSSSFSRNLYGYIILLAYSLSVNVSLLWIHYLFQEYTISSLFFRQICYESTIFLANLLWLYYLFRTHYQFTILLLILMLLFIPKFDFSMFIFDFFYLKLDLKQMLLGSKFNYISFNMHILYIWSWLRFLTSEWLFWT